jgi:predicted RNase H-related nuclease YkuK (DUF458 family)
MMQELLFHSPTYGVLDFEAVVSSLFEFIREEPERQYRIIIGTDSKDIQETPPVRAFVTALIVHRVGFGGRYFWRRVYLKDVRTIRDIIYHEAYLSLQVSQKLVDLLHRFPGNHLSNYNVEIHIDVGHNGPTRNLIREVVGMIESMGFVAKVKPESFGASHIAHRHT